MKINVQVKVDFFNVESPEIRKGRCLLRDAYRAMQRPRRQWQRRDAAENGSANSSGNLNLSALANLTGSTDRTGSTNGRDGKNLKFSKDEIRLLPCSQQIVENLQKRFPNAPRNETERLLVSKNCHGGQVALELRKKYAEVSGDTVIPPSSKKTPSRFRAFNMEEGPARVTAIRRLFKRLVIKAAEDCEKSLEYYEHKMHDINNEIVKREVDDRLSFEGIGVCCTYRLILKITDYICGNVTTPIDDHHVRIAKELIDPRMAYYIRRHG